MSEHDFEFSAAVTCAENVNMSRITSLEYIDKFRYKRTLDLQETNTKTEFTYVLYWIRFCYASQATHFHRVCHSDKHRLAEFNTSELIGNEFSISPAETNTKPQSSKQNTVKAISVIWVTDRLSKKLEFSPVTALELVSILISLNPINVSVKVWRKGGAARIVAHNRWLNNVWLRSRNLFDSTVKMTASQGATHYHIRFSLFQVSLRNSLFNFSSNASFSLNWVKLEQNKI